MNTLRALAVWLFFGWLLLPAGAAAAIEGVTLILSDEGAAYTEFSDSLSQALSQGNNPKTSIRVVFLHQLNKEELARSSKHVLLAVGSPAMQALALKAPAMPVLNVLVPRASFLKSARQNAKAQDTQQFSAIFFDQPWARQFALIRYSLPGRTRVGILLGKESAELASTLQAAAKEAELVANIEIVQEEADLLPVLKRLLNHSDVLLAIPDTSIYNRNNISSILLSSYRSQIPLFGFSASFVKAGALAALYSQPAQIAQQVAEIIQNLPAGGQLPAPQFARYFSVGVNSQVKHSLALSVDEEAELLRKIKQNTVRAP